MQHDEIDVVLAHRAAGGEGPGRMVDETEVDDLDAGPNEFPGDPAEIIFKALLEARELRPVSVEADAETPDHAPIWEPDRVADREANADVNWHVFGGTLIVAADQDVDLRDSWKIGGEQYQTETLGDPDGGLRELRLKRVVKRTTTRNRNRL